VKKSKKTSKDETKKNDSKREVKILNTFK
jgi:hypothetical protein